MFDRRLIASGALCFAAFACLVIEGHAQAPPHERGPGDPVWVQWMRPDSPEDQTTLHYWEMYKNNELEPEGMVDLGTMLFKRGFPNDAIRMYRRALRADPQLYEAWFHIGLVEYNLGEIDDARHAYGKCLKIAPDHGWCAFYLALLEEETGHPSRALELYRRAFQSSPELADPAVNPELLGSRLYLGALLAAAGQSPEAVRRPMTLPDDEEIESVLSREPTPAQTELPGTAGGAREESASPATTPPPMQPVGQAPGGGSAVPMRVSVSPEASLAPLLPRLPDWVLALI